jgi:hypothetical protein
VRFCLSSPPFFSSLLLLTLRASPSPQRSSKLHYHVLFSVSYGLSRDQLSNLCHEVRHGNPERFEPDFMSETAFREMERKKRRTPMAVYESAVRFSFDLICCRRDRN